MYIKSLQLNGYRGIRNFRVEFNEPTNNSNTVNVLIGKNGSGKTSILELIANYYKVGYDIDEKEVKLEFANYPDFDFLDRMIKGELSRKYVTNLQSEIQSLTSNDSPPFKYSQIIYLPAIINMGSVGTKIQEHLSLGYEFSRQVGKNIVQKAAIYIKEYIVAQERLIEEKSPEIRARKAIEKFNENFEQLNLSTYLYKLDPARLNKPIFRNISGDEVGIDELSDGEKQIYSRLVGLMMLEPKDSIILIDEPEAALHPSWQFEILKLYCGIGTGNQFIFATHSPQVLASTSWKNVQVLERNAEGVKVTKLNGAPSGSDSSSVLKGIMNIPSQPREVEECKIKYRKLLKMDPSSSELAKKLKARILDYENEDSVFFQEMKLLNLLKIEQK